MFDFYIALDSKFLLRAAPEDAVFTDNDNSHNIFHASCFEPNHVLHALKMLKKNNFGLYYHIQQNLKICLLREGCKKFNIEKPVLVFTKI